ncbi:hypothetical protein MMIN_25640 [Mycolicibacter minnesotensis]|nr:hypothetical protein MMIN_25640 [Mycolicibacter minnesotensis]
MTSVGSKITGPAVQRASTKERRNWDRRIGTAVQRASTKERRNWDRRTGPAVPRGSKTGPVRLAGP